MNTEVTDDDSYGKGNRWWKSLVNEDIVVQSKETQTFSFCTIFVCVHVKQRLFSFVK